MKFGFGFHSTALLIFFFHMLVFSGLQIWLGFTHKLKSAHWLGAMLFLVAIYISPFMFGYAGWYGLDHYRETLFYLPLQQILFIGPVFLFYLKSLLYANDAFSRKDWPHFLPGTLYLLYSLIVFVFDVFISDEIFFYQDGRDKDFDLWYQVTGYVSMVLYFLLSLRIYLNYHREIFDNLSFAEEVAYNWVRVFLFTFLFILVARGLFFAINPEWGQFGRKFWYYLLISVVGYYLAIQGYRQSILLGAYTQLPKLAQKIINENDSPPNELEAPHLVIENQSSDDYADLVKTIDQKVLNERLYQNPTLTLSELAEHLGSTSKNISQGINKGVGLNFNDYVNRFRVEAFLREVEAGAHQQHSLLGIAFSCGFNSKSTFNRAFKKKTGLSPNDYVQKQSKMGVKS